MSKVFEKPFAVGGEAVARARRAGGTAWAKAYRLQAQTILISPMCARCHHTVIRDLAGSKEKHAFQSLVVLVLVPSLSAI